MSAAMHLAALRLPWQRAWRGSPWTSAAILLVLPVSTALICAWIGVPLDRASGLVMLGALTTLWYVQVDGWLSQNLPVLARLLPRQLQVLRGQLLGGGLAMAGLAAAVVAGFHERSLLEWLPVTALVVVLLAWMARFPWLWALIWIPPLGFQVIERTLQQAMSSDGGVVIALGLLGVGLWPVMGSGGSLHRWASTGAMRWRAAMQAQQRGEPMPAAARGPLGDRLGRFFSWPVHARRAALVRRASPANALARLELVLMGSGHWFVMLWAAVLLVLVIGGLAAWMEATRAPVPPDRLALMTEVGFPPRSPWQEWASSLSSASFGLCMMAIATATQLSASLLRTRREQALLVLLPGVPAGPALGQALRRRWLTQTLAGLALVAPIVLLQTTLAKPGLGGMLGGYLAAMAFAPLLVLRDWSRLAPGPQQIPQLLFAGVIGFAFLGAWSPWPAWVLPLVTLPLAAGLLAWQWRTARTLPAQLPAGRRAGLTAAAR